MRLSARKPAARSRSLSPKLVSIAGRARGVCPAPQSSRIRIGRVPRHELDGRFRPHISSVVVSVDHENASRCASARAERAPTPPSAPAVTLVWPGDPDGDYWPDRRRRGRGKHVGERLVVRPTSGSSAPAPRRRNGERGRPRKRDGPARRRLRLTWAAASSFAGIARVRRDCSRGGGMRDAIHELRHASGSWLVLAFVVEIASYAIAGWLLILLRGDNDSLGWATNARVSRSSCGGLGQFVAGGPGRGHRPCSASRLERRGCQGRKTRRDHASARGAWFAALGR